jgi:hypothetical protein
MIKCNCDFCKFRRRYKRLKKQITPPVDKFIDELWNHYGNEVEDLTVEILKLQGKWPTHRLTSGSPSDETPAAISQ